MTHIQVRTWIKASAFVVAGLFVLVMHSLAQSLITTAVGPQMPVSGNAAATQAIDSPVAAVPDGAGGIYVASSSHNRVYDIAADGTLRIIAGTSYGFGGDGGPAINARLATPIALALDSTGNIYISDSRNNRIRKVTKDGVITTVAGTGTAGFSGDGGPAMSAQLSNPNGIAFDAKDNLYIADTTNNRVRRVGTDGIITTVAGGGPAPGSGVSATMVSVSSPYGVAVDPAGNLYISAISIRRVTPDGIINTVVGSTPAGRFNSSCLSIDGGPGSTASVCGARGLAADTAGNIYVAENFGKVRKITPDGFITTIASQLAPYGLAANAGGTLYVAEPGNARVTTITPDGALHTFPTGTVGGFAGDGGPATQAQIRGVNSVNVDSAGSVYITDALNSNLRKITPDGVINTVGFFNAPQDVFIDGRGDVYVLANGQVFKMTSGGTPARIAGVGVGCPYPNDPIALNHQFCNPRRIAVDAVGTLYVAESLQVQAIGPDGIVRAVAGTGTDGLAGDGGPALSAQLSDVSGFALDPVGGFYLSGANRIQRVTPDGLIHTIAGVSPSCLTPGAPNGDGGPALSAQLCGPEGIALDAAGNLYVADASNQRIRVISPSGIITSVAGNGVAGFSGDGGPATSAQFAGPFDVALDAKGNLYIADSSNARIRKVSPAASTRAFNMGSDTADYLVVPSLPASVTVGYGTVQADAGKATPSAIEVYSYRPNGVLISETAVPASPLRQAGRIYAESAGPVRTGIAFASPNDQDAVISFYFTDEGGVNLNAGTITIPAHEQFAAFLDEAPYHGTATAQSFTFMSSVPVGAIALRVYVNERSEALLTTLPVAAVSSGPFALPPSGGSTIVPHFAGGGGWTTQVLLVNPTDAPLTGTVDMDASYTYTIAPRASAKIVSSNWDSLRTGNIRVTSTDPVGCRTHLLVRSPDRFVMICGPGKYGYQGEDMKNKNWRAVISVMALFAAIFVFVTADAHAQGATAASLDKVTVSTDVAKRTLTKMQINAETARAIVDACVQFGKASNASYSIFVLAPNGDVIDAHVMDGQLPIGVETALLKAKTALYARTPSSAVAQRFNTVDGRVIRLNLGQSSGLAYYFVGGGLPIVVQDQLIGAIGVGGGNMDEMCAYTALTKVLGPQPPLTPAPPPAGAAPGGGGRQGGRGQ